MHFDEYGQPNISPEEEACCGCLLEPLRAGPNCPSKISDRENEVLREDMGTRFGLCMLCWIPLEMPHRRTGRPDTPPEGWTEVCTRRGELTTGRYAVPKRAVRSLETLWSRQKSAGLSDRHFYQLRYSDGFYLQWVDDTSKETISLYPWTWQHEKWEADRRKER